MGNDGRGILAGHLFKRASSLLLGDLVEGLAVEREFPGQGLDQATLRVRWRLVATSIERAIRDIHRACRDWSVGDAALVGAEVEICAELGAETERGECTANGLGCG